MRADAVRYPVEVITVGLENDRPTRNPANDDVAYVLVTRFNVRMRIGKKNRWSHLDGRHLAESAEYDDYWLRRLDLFERVCIPSVLALTPRPDAWFVAFGDIDSWYVQALLERLRPYPWIKPYFREKGHADDAGPLPELLGAYVRSLGKPFLCSTRFDSDDSLHSQFVGGLDRAISQLRKRGFSDERRCLNFVFGLLQSAGELSVFLRKNNMFESVFEPADQVQGPYQGSHDEIRDRMPLVEVVTNLPMWIYHRHEDTLEPPWVTSRDRLPLGDSAAYYPLFGLEPDSVGARPTSATGAPPPSFPWRDPRSEASALRDAAYWNASQVALAIELASAQEQPTLTGWLQRDASDESDPVMVLQELESGTQMFLNGARLAGLARELREQGEAGAALRVFDYAVLVSPHDRHLRAEREELASSISHEMDLEEQIELAGIVGSSRERSNTVVLIGSVSTVDSDSGDFASLRARVDRTKRAGFDVRIILVPDPGQPVTESSVEASFGSDGAVETLRLPDSEAVGLDATMRGLTRQLAVRVFELSPSLLFTDGTLVAQRLAAAVGRACAIAVDFSLESDAESAEPLDDAG